jgi:glucokinase
MGDKVIAIDLGGTNLRTALVEKNKIKKYIKKKTPKNKNDLLREMVDSISCLMTKDVKAIGVGSPGPLKNGIIQNPPNLPFRNFNLKKYLEMQFKKRVVIENDAKCVAIAEANLGCRKKNFIILTLGTGIGGGIIINGKLYKGNGNAGELGHIVLDNGKDFETCWKEKGKKIKELFENNEKEKLQIVSKYLGQGIGSLINVFDPEIVIIAGGIKENGSRFLNMIKKEVKKYQIIPRNVEIKFSRLEHPGILGASLLVR